MHKHPMLTVKQAAVALGLDERSIRERLIQGQLKGEKRMIGLREKWFVFGGAIETELQKKREMEGLQGQMSFAPNEQTITVEAQPFDATPDDTSDADSGDWDDSPNLSIIVEQLMKPLVEKVSAQAHALSEKDRIIEEQGRQLRLLPDLEKQAEEIRKTAEVKSFEVGALSKQVSALQEELLAANQRALKVAELESAIKELQVREEENKAAAMDELKRLQEQKEAAILEQLGAVQQELKKLREPPWWKKFLGLGSGPESDG